MTTSLRLRRLFRTLTITSLAASGSACESSEGAFDRSNFPLNVCGPSSVFDELTDVQPAVAVDYLAVRWASEAIDSVVLASEAGTPCATAAAIPACMDALAAVPIEGWTNVSSGFEPSSTVQFLYTRGDEVGSIDTHAELVTFLGTVDSANEAAVLAMYDAEGTLDARVDCGATNAREKPGGFEILLTQGSTCGPGTHLDELRFFVATDGTVMLLETRVVERGDPGCVIGRLTDGVRTVARARDGSLGARLAEMAELEAAAVVAFQRLARELELLGAPDELIQRAQSSARDEIRHASLVGELARRHGGVVGPLHVSAMPERALLTIARENAVEGTVRETYGAALATVQAELARDPELARSFDAIAIDETNHAALSLDLARWFDTRLTADERTLVREERDRAAEALFAELGREDARAVDHEARRALGLPDAALARRIFSATFPAAWC